MQLAVQLAVDVTIVSNQQLLASFQGEACSAAYETKYWERLQQKTTIALAQINKPYSLATLSLFGEYLDATPLFAGRSEGRQLAANVRAAALIGLCQLLHADQQSAHKAIGRSFALADIHESLMRELERLALSASAKRDTPADSLGLEAVKSLQPAQAT